MNTNRLTTHTPLDDSPESLESIDTLQGVIAGTVGDFDSTPPPLITSSMIHERAEREGVLDTICGYSKDSKKCLGWNLMKLRGRHLCDTKGRFFSFGERGNPGRSVGYQIRFIGENENSASRDGAGPLPCKYDVHDLFGEPLAHPSPELLEALAHPDLTKILAAARLMRKTSMVCRGAGEPAGWTCLMDGIPALFNIGINHTLRKPFAALAGLIVDPVMQFLNIDQPEESDIQKAESELAIHAAERFAAAAEFLRKLAASRE